MRVELRTKMVRWLILGGWMVAACGASEMEEGDPVEKEGPKEDADSTPTPVVTRHPERDVGAYQAFRVSRDSSGPGDPGHSLQFRKDGQIMVKEGGDWTDFLGAAVPAQVAMGLARPLDIVLIPSGPQGQNPYHPLQKLPESVRAQITDPQHTADGTIQFYVLDGRGDRRKTRVLRFVATPLMGGGIDLVHELVKPSG
jgi:hypothetical protein